VIGLVADHRLVTLTGTGGIGKTRLALEAARHLLPQFADGVWIAELASLSDPQLVPVTVATALGLELARGERIAAALGSKHIMLVLDNCEHVIDAAAGMVEALLHANPAARVIAKSREPLRAESEPSTGCRRSLCRRRIRRHWRTWYDTARWRCSSGGPR